VDTVSERGRIVTEVAKGTAVASEIGVVTVARIEALTGAEIAETSVAATMIVAGNPAATVTTFSPTGDVQAAMTEEIGETVVMTASGTLAVTGTMNESSSVRLVKAQNRLHASPGSQLQI
jgi:hypothetical protein